MAVTHAITLNIDKDKLRLDQKVHVRTGDVSSQVVSCSMQSGGAAFTPASGSTAKLEILKPDGTWTVTNASISGSTVRGTVPAAAMSAPGECKRAYFRIISEDGTVEDTTEDFYLYVYASATQDAIESTSYTDAFDELLAASSKEAADTFENVGVILDRLKDYDGRVVPEFEMGAVLYKQTANWTYTSSRKRVRVPQGKEFHLEKGDVIGLSDYNAGVVYYVGMILDDGTYSYSGWRTTDFVVAKPGYYSMLLRYEPEVVVEDMYELTRLVRVQKSSGYTLLDVEELQEVAENRIDFTAGKWERGSVSASGVESDSDTRLRTSPFRVPEGDRFSVEIMEGYQVAFITQEADGTVVSDHYWLTSDGKYKKFWVIQDGDRAYRFVVQRSDGEAIDLSEWKNAVAVRHIQAQDYDVLADGWTYGSIFGSGASAGEDRALDARCRTNRFIKLKGPTAELTVPEGWMAYIWTYNADRSYVGVSEAYYGGVHLVPVSSGNLYRVTGLQVSREDFETEDINGIVRLRDSVLAQGSSTDDGLTQMEQRVYQQLGYTTTSAQASQNVRIVHFSDIHGDQTRLSRIVGYANAMDGLDGVVCTGDILNSHWDNDFDFWDAASAENVMFAMGNHDEIDNTRTWADVTHYKTMAECYQRYYSGRIEDWGVTYQQGITYFYKDFGESLRMVFLDLVQDGLVPDATQLAWFAGVLSDARTNGLPVVVAEHFPPANRVPVEGAEGWYNACYTHAQQARWTPRDAWHDAIEDFTDAGGEFICWLCGHTHADLVSVNSNYPEQLFVVIDCASPFKASPYSDTARAAGTATQDLFNVVGFDTVRKNIRIMRIGASETMLMQTKKLLCYDYATHRVIGGV